MPNWAYNTLTIEHNDVKVLEKIKEELRGNDGSPIDFDKIIPMPETLNVDSPLHANDLMFYILTLAKDRAEILELPQEILHFIQPILDKHKTDKSLDKLYKKYIQEYTEQVIAGTADKRDDMGICLGISLLQGYRYFMNITRYGFDTWYKWCNTMWNTKWNASEGEVKLKGNELEYYFETAWSGPWPIAAAISALYEGTEVTLNVGYEDPDGEDNVVYRKGRAVDAYKSPQVYEYAEGEYDSYEEALKAAEDDGVDEDDAWAAVELSIGENTIQLDAKDWDVNTSIIQYAKLVKESA